jgi:hypothetical protein
MTITPAVLTAQASPDNRRSFVAILHRALIERAVGLIRGGSNTRAAVRHVGLRVPADEKVVKRLCDKRGIVRRRNPLALQFETHTPWPVRITARAQ